MNVNTAGLQRDLRDGGVANASLPRLDWLGKRVDEIERTTARRWVRWHEQRCGGERAMWRRSYGDDGIDELARCSACIRDG
jgi:hypothetical protein